MDHAASRQTSYSNDRIASALDALARDRGLESRSDTMRAVIVEALEDGGYLKPVTSSNLQDMLSDDVMI